MTTRNSTTTDASSSLCTPWSLHFDRDGTEDYGIIRDADGNQIAASHLTSVQDPFEHGGTFWLPETDGDPMPATVRKLRLMTAAPKLLDLLRIAVATADQNKHRWVKEAFAAIAEATGQEHDAKQADPGRQVYQAAPRLLAALDACYPLLVQYRDIAQAAGHLLGGYAQARQMQVEKTCRNVCEALADARGDITF
jgi:hypothetical protein